MEESENSVELKSPSVQEILGRPPRSIIRWGTTVIFVVVAGLFVGSYFFKYPDIITGTITVTTENLPAGVIAKTSGRIDTIFVREKEFAQKGALLALIENSASLNDVLLLKRHLISDSSFDEQIKKDLRLGDIQQSYFAYIKAHEDYRYFITADYHRKKITVIKKQIETQNSVLKKSQNTLRLNSEQLQSAKKLFVMDSLLYAKKALSDAEYQSAKNTYLQQLQANENARLNIDNQKISILQLEQTVFDLEQQRNEELNSLRVALSGAYDGLLTQIKQWEQMYLPVSPVNGTVTLTKYWQKNQNVSAGEVIVTVVPDEKASIIGKITLPPLGAGKVKEGQTVNVKFDNFPYMEFGMLKVQIKNISLVPVVTDGGSSGVGDGVGAGANNKAYVLEVVFPDTLKTNYGKELVFSQEMQGTAEIITDDLRLLDKLINPIKAALKK
ncbi:MAG: HlyD family secretion protein [Bacteroidales bacterium]|jgi:HlyD family secretion protein|nr:HlyD family secretion protein [Bacteroidales bacterium]